MPARIRSLSMLASHFSKENGDHHGDCDYHDLQHFLLWPATNCPRKTQLSLRDKHVLAEAPARRVLFVFEQKCTFTDGVTLFEGGLRPGRCSTFVEAWLTVQSCLNATHNPAQMLHTILPKCYVQSCLNATHNPAYVLRTILPKS